MNGFRQGWLVAKRELRERSRSRAFLASLAIMITAVVGVIALPAIIDASAGTKNVGVTGSNVDTLTEALSGKETPSERRSTSTATKRSPRANKPYVTGRSTF